MRRYFFDMRDGDKLIIDEEGMEFSSLAAVQEEAALSLADLARDAVYASARLSGKRDMAIEVRDTAGPVLQVKFTFEAGSSKA